MKLLAHMVMGQLEVGTVEERLNVEQGMINSKAVGKLHVALSSNGSNQHVSGAGAHQQKTEKRVYRLIVRDLLSQSS